MKRFGKFSTKNYEIDLFAPLKLIIKDIIRLAKDIRRNHKKKGGANE